MKQHVKSGVLQLVETALMLALLICLQSVTKPMGQLVTGTCVNAVLALTVLLVGVPGGMAVALFSPVFAFLLGIAPNIVVVLPIMLGNLCFVLLLRLLYGTQLWKRGIALVAAAAAKFAVLYLLVTQVICNLLADHLMFKKVGDNIVLAPKMLTKLPAMFTWPQLITALAGGALALALTPVLRKALRRK